MTVMAGLASLALGALLASPEVEPAPEVPASELEWDGEDTDAWLADMEAEGPAEAASSKTPEVATGALRMTGGYLHFPDIPELYPTGDDGIGVGVLRMIVDHDLSQRLQYELNIFGDLTRAPPVATGGAFATAGSTQSAYRSHNLSWGFWDDGSIRGSAGVDRFALRLHAGRFSFAAGRFPINHSVTAIFTPNDFFAPFSATAINRIYKPGVDAVSVGVGLGALSSIEVSGVMGYDDDGRVDWGRAALIARASAVFWSTEWAVMGGKIAERWMAALSVQADVAGPLGLRAESHVGFPDVDGDGTLDEDRDPYVRAAGGPSLTFGWRGTMISAEYAFSLDGADDPAEYLERAARFFPDDLPYLGQHYVGAVAGLETIPILRLNAIGLVNAGDGSGLAGAFLAYNISDEADFVGGVYAPWGRKPRLAGFPLVPPELRSEFGQSPFTVFVETRFYF